MMRHGRPLTHVNATSDGGAVEISGSIEDQAGYRIDPICAVAEILEHRLLPLPSGRRSQFKHRSATVGLAVEAVTGTAFIGTVIIC